MEYDLLSKLFAGASIGEALTNVDESAVGKLSEYFSRWMRNGMLRVHEHNNEQTKRSAA